MKIIVGIVAGSLMTGTVVADKPPIDEHAYQIWLHAHTVISNDGRFVHSLTNGPYGSDEVKPQQIIQSLDGQWQRSVAADGAVRLTADSRFAVVSRPDRLEIIALGTDRTEEILGVKSYELSYNGGHSWLAYTLSGQAGILVLRNLATRVQRSFASVANYFFNGSGDVLVYEGTATSPTGERRSLHWLDLNGRRDVTFWSGKGAGGFLFGPTGRQLAFLGEAPDNAPPESGKSQALWYYRQGKGRAERLVNSHTPGMEANDEISSGSLRFSGDGAYVLFNLEPPQQKMAAPGAVQVDVWGYRDLRLPNFTIVPRAGVAEGTGPRSPRVRAVGTDSHDRVAQIAAEGEFVETLGGDWALVQYKPGRDKEVYWNPAQAPFEYLVSLRDGSRKDLNGIFDVRRHSAGTNVYSFQFSLAPSGRFVVYADEARRAYFSYEIDTGKVHQLNRAAEIKSLTLREYPFPDEYFSAQIEGWLEDRQAILVRDDHDLWMLDLTGAKPAVNFTQGFGAKHHLELRVQPRVQPRDSINQRMPTPSVLRGELLLFGFEEDDKSQGFLRVPARGGMPQWLSKGPFAYTNDVYFPPDLIRRGSVWIVERQSVEEEPNYFWTKDFKEFHRISDVHSQRDYSWMTGELVRWTTFDQRSAAGILYKPENFDPKKKYPLVLFLYETLSQNLHRYLMPEHDGGTLGIPWLVSHGYLVFCPDIHYTIGSPGESALNYVVSAAENLGRNAWVDTTKMGIQGHSWGGFEVDYIVTHTGLFAAAYSGSGLTDLVTDYGTDKAYDVERSQIRMGATLWDARERYIENSPIFYADKVSTPLLMMHNKADAAVPYTEGMEFFTALRRLQKKVWMLQYDGEHHSVINKKAAADLDIHIEQFLDHYLKGAPPPKWMTQGIPAQRKGIETGLELDTSGRMP